MGSTAAKKFRRQKSAILPKKSISKIETKEKNKKRKGKPRVDKAGNDPVGTAVVKEDKNALVEGATASQQLSFFIHQYQSANGVQLSSLEIDSLEEARFLEICPGSNSKKDGNLGEQMKAAFGSSWKEILCEKQLRQGSIDPGNPALLVISSSALRTLELLREFRSLTKECHAAKLFSKHMKIEEQVSLLKNRVNIACGTPSRIKKLMDMEALGLSRLALIVLDMHKDVKGYSLFTLPQVRDEFWDLYKCYFHQPLLKGDIRICLYNSVTTLSESKKKKKKQKQRSS